MYSIIRKCAKCHSYSMVEICKCGSRTVTSLPARYSPDDRYGEYRRRGILEEYGENGKCRV